MSDIETIALRQTVQIAARHMDGLTEQEREAVLMAAVAVLPSQEGEVAQTALYHLQQQRKAQLTLCSILNGLSRKPEAR